MKIEYSRTADALYVSFREVYVSSSKEIEDGVVVDFDEKACIIGIEILDASKRLKPAELANINIENIPLEIGA